MLLFQYEISGWDSNQLNVAEHFQKQCPLRTHISHTTENIKLHTHLKVIIIIEINGV